MIAEFQGDYRWLSNFWPSPIRFRFLVGPKLLKTVWPTVEHAYQGLKCSDSELAAKILLCRTPAEARSLGRKYSAPTSKDNAEARLTLMAELVLEKYRQNGDLWEKLLSTGDTHLQEGNLWGDEFWGVNLRTGKGLNWLGRITMGVREKLRNE